MIALAFAVVAPHLEQSLVASNHWMHRASRLDRLSARFGTVGECKYTQYSTAVVVDPELYPEDKLPCFRRFGR